MTDIWPISMFPTRDFNWYPDAVTGDGAVAADGTQRPWQSDGGGKWMCTMTIDLFTPRAVKLARAMRARMEFGNTPVVVPCTETSFAPWPDGVPARQIGFGNGTLFSTGAGFQVTTIDIRLAASAALRATELSLDVVYAGALIGGERFSIDHGTKLRRMYDIMSVVQEDDDTVTVGIWPPLREAVAGGVRLDFDRPGCVMRMVNHKEIMGAIGLNRFSSLVPVFQEVAI